MSLCWKNTQISVKDGLCTEPHVHMKSEVYIGENKEHLHCVKFQWEEEQC
jgi:hypothetical protein